MEKHEREKLQEKNATTVLLAATEAIKNSDWVEAKKLVKLYNSIEMGY